MARPDLIATVLLALGVLIGAVRLVLVRRDGRAFVLIGLAIVSAVLLYLTLFPPPLPIGGETMLVATAETPTAIRVKDGERLVALPEAPRLAAAERVPDLATALRRYPQVRRIAVLGRGLTARDRDANPSVPVTFRPLPLPNGLIRLEPPADIAAGSIFTVAGATNGLDGGTAELLDPAGRRVDQRRIGGGRFTLGAAARAPGFTLFTLRLRDANKTVVSDTPVPLRVRPRQTVRVMLLGAPSPEAKYIRRWAEDSGIDLTARLDAGGGVQLGDTPVPIDGATLRRFDALIVDDRTLSAMGGGRAVIAAAVANGLGLIVRMTGPATPASRREWQGLGLTLTGGDEVGPVALAPLASDAEALAAQRGPGSSDVGSDVNTVDDPAPELGRYTIQGTAELVPAVSDDTGALLSGWRQRGQARVAIWAAADSFALVLNGQADRYYQWWSTTLSAVARPSSVFKPDVPPLSLVGDRIAICGAGGTALIVDPAGRSHRLVVDPAAGARDCAAYWPAQSGLHRIVASSASDAPNFVFNVMPKGAVPSIVAADTADATQRWAATYRDAPASSGLERRGAAWPWFLSWLLSAGVLYYLERRWRIASV